MEKKKKTPTCPYPSQHALQNSCPHDMSTGSSNTEIEHRQIPHCRETEDKHIMRYSVVRGQIRKLYWMFSLPSCGHNHSDQQPGFSGRQEVNANF